MDSLANYITHPLLFVTLVIVWFAVFAWIISKFFDVLIRYFISKTKTTADDKLVPVIKNSMLAGLFVSAMYVVTVYVDVPEVVHTELEKLYFSLMVLIGAFLMSNIISILLIEFSERKAAKSDTGSHPAVPFMNNIIRVVVLSIGVLCVMRIYKVDITPALASAGVAGVAIAFAAKDFVANLFGGISVFFDKPYSIGDYVIVDTQYRGEVIDVGMRSTKIRTRDNVLLTVPNSVMVTNTVVNETGFEPRLRIRIPIQVAYESNLQHVEDVLNKVAAQHKEILKDPEPRIRYRAFEDSGIRLEVLVVISEPAERGRIMHELIMDIHDAFNEEKITIPFPQRVVHEVK